jgi:hypothetical protein
MNENMNMAVGTKVTVDSDLEGLANWQGMSGVVVESFAPAAGRMVELNDGGGVINVRVRDLRERREVHEVIETHRSAFAGPTDDYLTWKERRSDYDLMLIGALMYEIKKAYGGDEAKADAVILDCAQSVAGYKY